MLMRLQVDARLLYGGGIGRYLRELSTRWLQDPMLDRIRFFGRPAELEPWLAEVDHRGVAEVAVWRDGPYSARAQCRWPLIRRRQPWQPDVTFFPHFDVPLLTHPDPSVVAVHDLIHFQEPLGFPLVKRLAGTVLLRGALDRARAVVTVSRTSRAALERFHPGVAARLHTIPNGVSDIFRPLSDEERTEALRHAEFPERFLLTVGRAKRHKRLDFAVRVLADIPVSSGLHLVMVGAGDADAEPLMGLARSLGVGHRVHPWASVTDRQLRTLYGLATALLVPSSVEGFGLPVLESLACGGRALVPDLPWARELSPAATHLPPDDPAAWSRAVLTGIGAPVRAFPAGKDHSWNVSARRTLEVIEQCARG